MVKVTVGIIIQPGAVTPSRVLLCQRKKTSRYGLKWEFPGGKVEDAETVTDCLRRELREELNIEASIGELYHRQNYVYPDSGTFDVHYYIVLSFSGHLANRVFESVAWVPLNDLENFDILEGNKDVVQKLMKNHEQVASR